MGLLEFGPPKGQAQRAGVLLHGRGGSADDMYGLAERLGIDGVRWVIPDAPDGSWYPLRFMEPLASNEPSLTDAVARCDQAVDDASDHGRIDPAHIAVVGFSQGACLTTEYVLRHPGRCGAIIVFTGGLIGPPGTTWKLSGAASLSGLRALVTGSDVDPWIPEARARETADVLGAFGADARLQLYPGRPHVVSDAEILEARGFL